MFGLDMLDVVIGTIFVFLLLSLICTAVNEIIEGFLKKRASELALGIRELLNDPEGNGLAKNLYEHPLVFGLFKGAYTVTGSNLPSYIPARNFALALMDVVAPATDITTSGASCATTSSPDPETPIVNPLQSLRDSINQIQNTEVKRALLTLVDAAGDDVNKARENIENWYDSSMDRVSGWYKRRSQKIVLFLGLLVAVAMNADAIAIVRSLSENPSQRAALVAAAQNYDKPQINSNNTSSDGDPLERIKKINEELPKYGLPIGWDSANSKAVPPWGLIWLLKIIGWLITAIAISLGAPFWFDVLNKFMVIRSTVKPHEKSPEESSEDHQTQSNTASTLTIKTESQALGQSPPIESSKT